MAKKSDKPIYSFIRHHNHLVPEMDYDTHALDGVEQGQRVQVTIKEWRNVKRLRAYWMMLQEVVEATGSNSLNAERLHAVLKLENGVVDHVALPGGVTVAIPASIALDKMSEAEFIEFFEKAQQWLAETYGYVAPELNGGK